MWVRFTESVRRVVFYAQEEASGTGARDVTPEHLLLGLLRESGGVGEQVLTRLGADTGRLLTEARGKPTPRNPWSVSSPENQLLQDVGLTVGAKDTIDFMYDEARKMNQGALNTRHLLLGLLRENGKAARVLLAHGVTLEAARATVRAAGSETPEAIS